MRNRPLLAPSSSLGSLRARAKSLVSALLVFLFAGGIAVGSSQVIQIDLGSDPSGRPDPTAPNWNIISDGAPSGTTVNLVDFNTGSSTGVTMERTGFGFPAASPLAWFGDNDWVETASAYDGFVVFGGNDPLNPVVGTVTLSGLDNAAQYRVELVAAWGVPDLGGNFDFTNSQFFDQTDYEVQGQWADRTFNDPNPVPPTVGLDWSPVLGTIQSDWMIWDDVSPTAGQISIVVTPDTANNNQGILNAIRITQTAVPEPSGVFLMLLGLVGLIWRR
ncbi:MAG: PEP-CTERM sorting domain-containing protein [Verrucomicrobiota bacterium]